MWAAYSIMNRYIPATVEDFCFDFFVSFQCSVTPCLSLRLWFRGVGRVFADAVPEGRLRGRFFPLTSAFLPTKRWFMAWEVGGGTMVCLAHAAASRKNLCTFALIPFQAKQRYIYMYMYGILMLVPRPLKNNEQIYSSAKLYPLHSRYVIWNQQSHSLNKQFTVPSSLERTYV